MLYCNLFIDLTDRSPRILLVHRINFSVASQYPPHGATEKQVCQKLHQGKVDELQVEINGVLKKAHQPKSSISKEERKAVKQMREDKTGVIFTTDKGIAMVVMDKKYYIKKVEEL